MARIAWLAGLAGLGALVAAMCGAPAARAASPQEFCQEAGTDDALRPIPDSLVPAAVRLFGLSAMPAEAVRNGTYFRCFDRHVFVCNVGANLPCGKADTRSELAGANDWCVKNPDSDFIPMYVTGHDTIYGWRCKGTSAVTTGQVFHVGPRGFVAEMWKEVD